jgi:hypothetical protein
MEKREKGEKLEADMWAHCLGISNISQRNLVLLELKLDCVPNKIFTPETLSWSYSIMELVEQS